MKKDILSLLFMTLICASVMLSVMGIFKVLASDLRREIQTDDVKIETAAFKIPFRNALELPFNKSVI